MLSLVRAVLTPFRITFVLLSVLAIGMATGHISLFSTKVHAVDIDCDRTKDCSVTSLDTNARDEPLTPSVGSKPDLCLNVGDFQFTVPAGYTRNNQTGDCFPDPPAQVLGASTTKTEQQTQTTTSTPQVLSASTTNLAIGK